MKCRLAAQVEDAQHRSVSIEFLPESEEDQSFLEKLKDGKFIALGLKKDGCYESASIHLRRPQP